MKEIGFEDKKWLPKKSSGKTKKYETKIKSPIPVNREKLKSLLTEAVAYIYAFLTFSSFLSCV